jgi:endoglucanase
LIYIAADFKQQRDIPVYCGEFGVYNKNCQDSHRDIWYFLVRMLLDANGISWTTWDYKGSFGLFNKNTDELFDYDLNMPLVKLLGFTPPPQGQFYPQPETAGF